MPPWSTCCRCRGAAIWRRLILPRFEIIYSDEPTSRALSSDSVVARNRIDAADKAIAGLKHAQLQNGAKCYRVIDGHGMVVTRGPKDAARVDT